MPSPANPPPEAGSVVQPFKGPASYETEDAGLFFGRDRDSEQLLATILASRISLLYAPSGAGKTSLLNAKIIPRLEARGSLPIRVLAHDDPVDSVRVATLQTLLPPLEAEIAALERARQAIQPSGALTLDELLAEYDVLRFDDPRKQRLVSPVRVPTVLDTLTLPFTERFTPYFCRILRATCEVSTFSRHLATLSEHARDAAELLISEECDLDELLALLAARRQAIESDYEAILEWLYLPGRELRPFFDRLIQHYGRRRGGKFSLVLILDQFEELFTRFEAPRVMSQSHDITLPDWRLRRELLAELESLYLARSDTAGRVSLPISYVLSMREEYIARLDAVRRFAPEIDRASFHLSLLTEDSAREAIDGPAKELGYGGFEPDCVERILEKVVTEDGRIEPTHIQIICQRLWKERFEERPPGAGGDAPLIDLGLYRRLGEAEGILDGFFRGFFDAEEISELDRLELAKMLRTLITLQRTRNIVAQETLLLPDVSHFELRRRLLQRLVEAQIVRVETRFGSRFVEITHDFLISSILDALERESLHDPWVFPVLLGGVEDPGHRWELLDLLRTLITEGGSKNRVPRDRLVYKPLRRPALRQELLEQLIAARILQQDLGQREAMVEVTYDALVPSIQHEIDRQLADDSYRRFKRALAELRTARAAGARGRAQSPIKDQAFQLLTSHRELIEWDDLSRELMFRSAVLDGHSKDMIRSWIGGDSGDSARSADAVPPAGMEGVADGCILSRQELRALDAKPPDQLTGGQLQGILVSCLRMGDGSPEDRDLIRRWTRRLVDGA